MAATFKYKLFEKRNEERHSRFMAALSIEEMANSIIYQCIDNVFQAHSGRKSKKKGERESKVSVNSVTADIKSPEGSNRKRKYLVSTWYERSFVIFMILHKKIFNNNVYQASESTLQG